MTEVAVLSGMPAEHAKRTVSFFPIFDCLAYVIFYVTVHEKLTTGRHCAKNDENRSVWIRSIETVADYLEEL